MYIEAKKLILWNNLFFLLSNNIRYKVRLGYIGEKFAKPTSPLLLKAESRGLMFQTISSDSF